MTPEEIEKTISGMLSVQRELQESQIRQGQEIDRLLRLGEQLLRLNVERVTAELNLEERLPNLAQRVERLENH